MNRLRTVVFIDGRNFKKNLQEYSFNTGSGNKDYRLDEKHFDWQLFFQGVLDKFSKSTGTTHRIIRVYWYNADLISPYKENNRLVTDIFNKHKTRFNSLTEDHIRKLTLDWWKKERDNFNKAKDDIYEVIQKQTDFLEFKYVGYYIVKPYTTYRFEQNPNGSFFYEGTRQGEKGVDIGIAIDMIAKMNFYDVAILVSGDADFQPVVRYLKDHLKQVYQFSIATGVPPQINYLSAYLKSMVDVFQHFDEEELLSKYLKRKTVPNPILSVIDKRIDKLKKQKNP